MAKAAPLIAAGISAAGGIAAASMSKGGGGQGSQVVQQQSTQLPQWLQNAGRETWNRAQQVAADLKPQQIAQVAPLTAGQQSLIQSLYGNAVNQPFNQALNAAGATAARLQSFTPQQVQAGQLASTDLSPYMNPYTQSVIDTSLATGRQQLAQAQNQTGDQFAGQGAFGGSRQGVTEGVNNSQYALGAANLAAGLNSQNFSQAQQAAAGDIAGRYAADLANQQAGLQGAGLNLQAAGMGGNLATQQQQLYLQALQAALAGQGFVQGNQQDVNNYIAAQQDANNQLDTRRLALMQSALGSVLPTGGTTSTSSSTGQTSQTGGSPLLSGIGTGLGLMQTMLSPMGGSSGAFGAPAGSFGSSMIGGLMNYISSDERVKDDHGVIGHAHGVPVHAWNYKGDDTVHTGPMAQDLERSRYARAVSTDRRTGLKRVDQRRVPNGLTVDSVNPQWRKKKRRKGHG